MKPGIKPTTVGLQAKWFTHYTKATLLEGNAPKMLFYTYMVLTFAGIRLLMLRRVHRRSRSMITVWHLYDYFGGPRGFGDLGIMVIYFQGVGSTGNYFQGFGEQAHSFFGGGGI